MNQDFLNLTRTQTDFIQRHNSPLITLSIQVHCIGNTKEVYTVADKRNAVGKITLIETYKQMDGEWMFSTSIETYTESGEFLN
ncbi:hypothetical protein [Vibrio penaeicida]|uniref:SnoaL-like domain-containing protein n=1 Tax=Vibrio penaeicida TaxID=104609 RepID=A0AAV5P0F3_9VIBR|nr:hypothetical protein [Vibrio penaeicida]MDP2573374.1 hypothetical protein [Vibrio penaeicida]RTZ21917.1 hypothetical protein EKN09_16835 [Vibrio penaeicida]GLQ75737.1 hypothetical protein GCM10007932_51000 [Vibrio penaeicida]